MTTDNDPQPRAILDPTFTDELFNTVRAATGALYPDARIPETAMPEKRSLLDGDAESLPAPSADMLVVRIYSAEHWAYWRPRGHGYTTIQEKAGLWTLREARRQTQHCGPEKRIMFEPLVPQPERTP